MIKLHDVQVLFSRGTALERKALHGINISIKEGEFVIVIGSNGSGKSTLLNAIAGDVLPTKGKILFDDKNVTTKLAYQRAGLIARVFQDPLVGTCGNLTVAENMALAGSRGQSRGFFRFALPHKRKAFYAQMLAHLNLGLEYRLDTLMSMLSGGQRQAISLVMATLNPLKILLLDEHTASLDPKTAAFIMSLTENVINEHKLTAVMVTHSLHQALHVGTRTIMLHEGRIIYDVKGKERDSLSINDLLNKFGKNVDDDRLLL